MPSRLLADATEQGLVRFDAAGQIEPGLAERWIVIDEGRSYIFRLRQAQWANGAKVTADQVAAALRRRLGARGNPLRPFLSAVDEIVAMTPQVLEVRLSRQRPDLLKLFAQPEMAVFRTGRGGTGPMRIVATMPHPLLRPALDPARADPEDPREPQPEEDVRLIGERAAVAIARYAERRSDLVSGGTFAAWPLLATVRVPPADVRVDPAVGLFGLAVVSRAGFLADAANRAAVSQAIDRAAATATVAPAWEPVDRLLPDRLDSAAPPAAPAYAALPLEERRAIARARVAEAETGGEPVRLRVALPRGPGATLLFGQIAASLIAIGIEPERVGWDEPADLRLIDEVAPYDSGRWYLATACRPCSPEAQAALAAARDAPTMAVRAQEIARADRLLTDDMAFIPIARPLRWSLVAPRLGQWQPNTRAWHPLNRLRREPN
ncbi:ABC transporter substrate-binding protein [Sphingomonas lenta]|uniref:ABC transporter substrate-binding protein n=1 Tax=Sphingomonas lenta TaxID=1141887 RepID=UPI001FE95ABB|nr:ABC transporter substrate-binding protein [Sphingomonas lenta]